MRIFTSENEGNAVRQDFAPFIKCRNRVLTTSIPFPMPPSLNFWLTASERIVVALASVVLLSFFFACWGWGSDIWKSAKGIPTKGIGKKYWMSWISGFSGCFQGVFRVFSPGVLRSKDFFDPIFVVFRDFCKSYFWHPYFYRVFRILRRFRWFLVFLVFFGNFGDFGEFWWILFCSPRKERERERGGKKKDREK